VESGDSLRIRSYAPADRGAALELASTLVEGVAPWRNAERVRDAVTDWVRTSVDATDNASSTVFVAERGGVVIGLVSIAERQHFTGERDAYVGELVVAPEQQGRGVGRALMTAVENWARGRGYARLTLETGAGNRRARAFYAARGYVEEDVRLTKALDGCQLDVGRTDPALVPIGVFATVPNITGEVLLCHRRDVDIWEAPGGALERDEPPWDGVVREVLEETHLAVKVDRLTGTYWRPQGPRIVLHFRCHPVDSDSVGAPSSEADRLGWFRLDRLPAEVTPVVRERLTQSLHDLPAPVLLTQTGPTAREWARRGSAHTGRRR